MSGSWDAMLRDEAERGLNRPLVCAQCERGNHAAHDTWKIGPAKGLDAGCPRAVGAGREGYRGDSVCRCSVRIPNRAIGTSESREP